MSSLSIERWKRRVGRLHWDTGEEFSPFQHGAAREAIDTVLSDEIRTIQTCWAIFALMTVLVLTLLWVRYRKRVATRGLTSSVITWLWWERRRRGKRVSGTSIKDDQLETLPPKNDSDLVRDEILKPKTHTSKAVENRMDDSASCCEEEDDGRPITATLLDTSSPESDSNVDRDNRLIQEVPLPVLVTEGVEATVGSTPSSSAAIVRSRSRGVGVLRARNTGNDSTLFLHAASSTSRQSVASAAQDASNLAQTILVTQHVFHSHGLDPTLATEWAMRRQASTLSETSRREEDYRVGMRREHEQNVSERRFRQMRESMEYDKDWLEKIHHARDGCLSACLYSFSLCAIAALLVEVYWNVPSDMTVISFVSFLLGCDCEVSSATTDSDTISVWGMTSFSEYCAGTLYSWLPKSRLLCYMTCIGWRLLPLLSLSLVLNFCRCPSMIHQVITLATIVSLVSSRMSIALTEFAWYRLLPLSFVTLASVIRIWTFTSNTVHDLQRSHDDLRKRLSQALISLDGIHSTVYLSHVVLLGLLLAISPRVFQ